MTAKRSFHPARQSEQLIGAVTEAIQRLHRVCPRVKPLSRVDEAARKNDPNLVPLVDLARAFRRSDESLHLRDASHIGTDRLYGLTPCATNAHVSRARLALYSDISRQILTTVGAAFSMRVGILCPPDNWVVDFTDPMHPTVSVKSTQALPLSTPSHGDHEMSHDYLRSMLAPTMRSLRDAYRGDSDDQRSSNDIALLQSIDDSACASLATALVQVDGELQQAQAIAAHFRSLAFPDARFRFDLGLREYQLRMTDGSTRTTYVHVRDLSDGRDGIPGQSMCTSCPRLDEKERNRRLLERAESQSDKDSELADFRNARAIVTSELGQMTDIRTHSRVAGLTIEALPTCLG